MSSPDRQRVIEAARKAARDGRPPGEEPMVIASNLHHFIGDMQDEMKPVIIAYEHDERGDQYLTVSRVFERDGHLVLVAGRLLDVATESEGPDNA